MRHSWPMRRTISSTCAWASRRRLVKAMPGAHEIPFVGFGRHPMPCRRSERTRGLFDRQSTPSIVAYALKARGHPRVGLLLGGQGGVGSRSIPSSIGARADSSRFAVMDMNIEPVCRNAEVETLLSAEGLPVSDLSEASQLHLFSARVDGKLVRGSLGSRYLMASACSAPWRFDPAFLKAGTAEPWSPIPKPGRLSIGSMSCIFLPPQPPDFLRASAYEAVPRAEAPEAIAHTAQFASLCPASSTFMRKREISGGLRQRSFNLLRSDQRTRLRLENIRLI